VQIPIPGEPEQRIKTISQIFASPNHLSIFRTLQRLDSWVSVVELVRKSKVSKRTIYRVIKDFIDNGFLETKTVSRRRVYRLSPEVSWVGTLLEEPKVYLGLTDVPGRDHVKELVSGDPLARQIVQALLEASGPLTLRQLSAETGAWAIEVKARLNLLIDEGLVMKRDLGYVVNRKVASEILREAVD